MNCRVECLTSASPKGRSMKLRRYAAVLTALGAASSLLLLRHIRADDQESSNLVRLPIQHSHDDGALSYQPIGLKNAVVTFHESANFLASGSELLDYDMVRDEAGRLSRLRLTVRPESEKTRPAQAGSQAASLPASAWTVYEDLDGDSVFDAMVQVR